MILLDTCVISEIARARPEPAVLDWLDAQTDELLYLSALTVGEIQQSMALLEPGPRRDRLESWLGGLLHQFGDRILPVDVEVARRWGEMNATGRRLGRAPPPLDGLIAATAARGGLVIATRHVSDFEGTGVAVVNPWLAPRGSGAAR